MKLLTLCYVFPTTSKSSLPANDDVIGNTNVASEVDAVQGIDDVIQEMEEIVPADTPSSSSSSSSSSSRILYDYSNLFETNSNSGGNSDLSIIDYSSPDCLTQLSVRPVSVMVRRLPAKGETYRSVGEMQQKYRSVSILKVPRQSVMASSAAGMRAEGSIGVSALMKKKRKKRRDHTELRTKAHTKHNKMWKGLMAPLHVPTVASTRAVDEAIARQAAIGSDRRNTAEAIMKREQRKEKSMGTSEEVNGEEVDEEREGQVKRARKEVPGITGSKGSDSRREALAAAGRAAAIAAIAAAQHTLPT